MEFDPVRSRGVLRALAASNWVEPRMLERPVAEE